MAFVKPEDARFGLQFKSNSESDGFGLGNYDYSDWVAPELPTFTDGSDGTVAPSDLDLTRDLSLTPEPSTNSDVNSFDGSFGQESCWNTSSLGDSNLDFSFLQASLTPEESNEFEQAAGAFIDNSFDFFQNFKQEDTNSDTAMTNLVGSVEPQNNTVQPFELAQQIGQINLTTAGGLLNSDNSHIANIGPHPGNFNNGNGPHWDQNTYNNNLTHQFANVNDPQQAAPMQVVYGPATWRAPEGAQRALVEPEAFIGQAMTGKIVPWASSMDNYANQAFAQEVKTPTISENMPEMCHYALNPDEQGVLMFNEHNNMQQLPSGMGFWSQSASFPALLPLPQSNGVSVDNAQSATTDSKSLGARRADRKKTGGKSKYQPPASRYAGVPNGDALLQILGIWPRAPGQTYGEYSRVEDLRSKYKMRTHTTLSKRVNKALDNRWGHRIGSEYRLIQNRTPRSRFNPTFAIEKAIEYDNGVKQGLPAKPFSETLLEARK